MTIIRVIHALNDLLTTFDLRSHIFRVEVEFTTYYHGHPQQIFFRSERSLSDIFPKNPSFNSRNRYQILPFL